jgi:succinate dehydrogenase / fumarate reductase, flavoprotein subunit
MCCRTTGTGTCTTPSRGATTWGTRTPSSTCAAPPPALVYELEHYGVPFSRLANGRIYQRPFGGQSQNFGGEQAARTCAAADRTGHAILHTLYQQNIRARTHFFDEYLAIDLIRDEEGFVLGALVMSIATGEPLLIEAKTTLIATGGCGQLYRTNTNAHINTGDGMAMALRIGVPLQDMEFFQFHPTGIAGKGMLITEGARGEGGYLVNKDGERFMERYARKARDLASRDVVSRAIAVEVREGRGCGPNGDHALLRVDHLGEQVIAERLPGIRETCKTFLHLDPAFHPIPVYPTAHYVMGGIPTNRFGEVVTPGASGPRRWFPDSTPSASAPASRCTGPTGWGATPCSTSWSSAAPPPIASRAISRNTASTAPSTSRGWTSPWSD